MQNCMSVKPFYVEGKMCKGVRTKNIRENT